MNKLEEVRAAIIKTVPEIVEDCSLDCQMDQSHGYIVNHEKCESREIRLADVLVAIHALEPKKRPMYFNIGCDGGFYEVKYTYPDGNKCVIEHNGLGGVGVGWYFDKDDLSQQSPECIDFIHSLLCV